MTQADKAAERGGFVQYPCQLIYNCPVLNRDDKWVLLSIMGVCWTEGPYRLSYRDIAALSGVPISLLSSVAAKDGKPAKEGIMDRLKRLEYIRCVMGKEKDTTTGKAKGNAQTYIYVNYTKIWAESLTFKSEAYKVNEPVLNTNTPVSYTNRFVPHANSPVPNTNEGVSYTNEPVRDSRSKVGTYITYINSDKEDSKDTDAMSDDNRLTPTSSFANGDDDGNNGANNAPHRPDHHSSVNGVTVPVDVRHSEEVNGQSTSTLETDENNRLTNPPESLTQQNVSTDESSSRIERETANDTASSPVIEPTTDEVIHADARNNGDSYSPQSTAQTPAPETEQSNFGLTQPKVTDQQVSLPATGKGAGKGSDRKGGKKTTTLDMSPIAPPAHPDPDLPFNAEKILAWGDYGRGMKLRKSTRSDSKFVKALDAARVLEGKKGITENFFLTLYFNWMKGVSIDLTDLPEGALKSDTWPDYPVDLWVFAEHYEEEKTRYLNRKKELAKAEKQSSLKEQREEVQRKAALDAASRAKKNEEFYEELRRTRREA